MANKKRSVGVILVSWTEIGFVAVLQVRAKWNEEKNAPESWPGACQVTVHGKLEGEEGFLEALIREIKEELGSASTSVINALVNNGRLTRLVNDETEDKQSLTYGGVVKEQVVGALLAIAKTPTCGGFQIIRSKDVDNIVDIHTFDKASGVMDENVIAMFPDEKEAVRLAFEKLGCEKKPA
ncbi:hypothetical protein A2917_00350 [Candidatus Nomurabacteria bacterium RIFCSPLOWO2_01_FULL_42_17]|uniref:Nudix hydrolase domain-containing protein n=1 Tax=Candidatus Nomurabacteria bacterium RIFCSPLOWO2_01_FULL_42_17 TaxID=1801780 RepID=A0A1F6XNQ9_9BACT|nr:MAG: hypothetical protein A2917_00350 [Candidatus Nomurabacteria bacterium RIFCSPLOWO2_01_FULL_42_17]